MGRTLHDTQWDCRSRRDKVLRIFQEAYGESGMLGSRAPHQERSIIVRKRRLVRLEEITLFVLPFIPVD